MNNQERELIYTILLRLIDSGDTLTPTERHDLLDQLCLANCNQNMDDIISAAQNRRRLLLKRGTALENAAFTGMSGEVTIDTTNKTLRVHDGTTAGGTPLARADEINTLQTLINNVSQNILKKILPDWSSTVDKNINTEYTATTNGYLLMYYDDYNATSKLIINGTEYVISAISGASAGATSGTLFIPITIGDTYKYMPSRAVGSIATYIKFIPTKE